MRALGSDNIVDGMGPVGSYHIRRAVGGPWLDAMTLQVSRDDGGDGGRGTALALDMLRVLRGGANHTHSSFGIRTSSWREPLSSRKYHPAGESYRSLIAVQK